jgi:hypothetical protein
MISLFISFFLPQRSESISRATRSAGSVAIRSRTRSAPRAGDLAGQPLILRGEQGDLAIGLQIAFAG